MAKISPLGVFINCPFDQKYQQFFDALIFAVIRCGFVARCAREIDDGGGTRIDKIMTLIEECPYGIHDICREKFRYQQFMSDIAGQDIHAHGLDIPKVVTHVRDFLRTIGKHVPAGAKIAKDFEKFQKDKRAICKRLDLDWKSLTFHDQTYNRGVALRAVMTCRGGDLEVLCVPKTSYART